MLLSVPVWLPLMLSRPFLLSMYYDLRSAFFPSPLSPFFCSWFRLARLSLLFFFPFTPCPILFYVYFSFVFLLLCYFLHPIRNNRATSLSALFLTSSPFGTYTHPYIHTQIHTYVTKYLPANILPPIYPAITLLSFSVLSSFLLFPFLLRCLCSFSFAYL